MTTTVPTTAASTTIRHPSGITITSERKGDLIDHYIDGPRGLLGMVTESTRPWQRTIVVAYAPPADLGDAISLGEHDTLDSAVNAVLRVEAVVRKAAEKAVS